MEKTLYELISGLKLKCLAHEEQIRDAMDLYKADLHSLMALRPDEEMPCTVFTDRLGLSPSRASRVLSRLRQLGFIRTIPNPKDRRKISIALTDKGIQVRSEILERMKVCETQVATRLKSSQIARIRKALEELEEAL